MLDALGPVVDVEIGLTDWNLPLDLVCERLDCGSNRVEDAVNILGCREMGKSPAKCWRDSC